VLDETIGETHRWRALAKHITLRVRPGTGVYEITEDGTRLAYEAGDEFTIPFSEAASYLRGKNRRSFEIVEVFDDESGGELNGPRSDKSLT
jgi:hypothetical protein